MGPCERTVSRPRGQLRWDRGTSPWRPKVLLRGSSEAGWYSTIFVLMTTVVQGQFQRARSSRNRGPGYQTGSGLNPNSVPTCHVCDLGQINSVYPSFLLYKIEIITHPSKSHWDQVSLSHMGKKKKLCQLEKESHILYAPAIPSSKPVGEIGKAGIF